MRQVRHTIIATIAAVACSSPPAARAATNLDTVLDAQLPQRLRGRVSEAGSRTLLLGSAKPYADAKAALGRGEPEQALAALKTSRSDLFEDREALIRGEALSALGDHPGALKAFVTALEKAEVLDVGLDAARGLRKTLHALGKREAELKVLEALLDVRHINRRPDLLLAQVQALRAVKRTDDAAEWAWRLMLAYPTTAAAAEAERILGELKAQGVAIPTTTGRLELARIRTLIRSRAYRQATRALDAFERDYPSLKRAALMQRVDLLHRQRKRDEERALLERLYKEGLNDDDGPGILNHLARLAMAADDNETAIRYFDELSARFKDSSLAEDGSYMAAWLPYNSGDFLETHRRMLAFSDQYERSHKRTEALWYAGWAAYLGDEPKLAEAAWKLLVDEHPDSSLIPHVWYWMGRIAHRQRNTDEARRKYRRVLAEAPMSYYGFWAQARLAELGEMTILKAPPAAPSAPSIAGVVEKLGPGRPRLVDRGIALHAAGLETEAEVELRAADRVFRQVRDTEGRTAVANMLHRLGAHYVAFRLASSITRDGGELVTGEPWAWQAWRQSYPEAFMDEVDAAHEAHQVDKNLVWAVMRTESSFRPWIRSPVGARGLMQLMPKTARAIGRTAKNGRRHARRYRVPKHNVWLGTWYLKQLGERYQGQLAALIGAYNAGPRAMDGWIDKMGGAPLDEFVERIPYKETRRYTRRVIETYFVYLRMKGLPLPPLPRVMPKTPPSGGVTF